MNADDLNEARIACEAARVDLLGEWFAIERSA
jgi:hypothetical protein